MAQTKRDEFLTEQDRVRSISDDDVRAALLEFSDALDPEYDHAAIPTPTNEPGVESNSTATNYLQALRLLHERGLDLLGADASTVNDFMRDYVAEPERRRYDLVDYGGSIGKPYARGIQAALRAFYRYCAEPGTADPRPEVAVDWSDVDGSGGIIMFTERSKPKHGSEDLPGDDDLDALREACLRSQNTRRDRAFLELAAGTGQRRYALVTLRVGDVDLDADVPHVLLNPAIEGDGDKGAIDNTGRWKPITSDTGPIRMWIQNHPLRDPEVRASLGAPDDFSDCYLFVGDLKQGQTDPTSHWSGDAAYRTMQRRKADTADLPGVNTVDVPVNPHNWRHYAYTQSKDLPIDESKRRKVFGWAKGSDTGERVYAHIENEQAGRDYAEAWAEAFGDADAESVAQQVVGATAAGDLAPEVRQALIQELVSDPEAMRQLGEAVSSAAE